MPTTDPHSMLTLRSLRTTHQVPALRRGWLRLLRAGHRPALTKSVLRALPLLILLALLAACDINPNATPIAMFPTAVPVGAGLPTFGAGGASGNPPTLQPNQPTNAPVGATVAPTVTFHFVNQPPLPAGPTTVSTATQPPLPTAIPTLDNNWTALTGGIDWRRLSYHGSEGFDVSLMVVRVDPTLTTLKVKYTAGQSKLIGDWHTALPGAVVIVNASYFDTSHAPIGLVAVDTVEYGSSVGRADAGMFQVVNSQFRMRQLWTEPFNNTERFDQAVQGFPVLVAGGLAAPAFDRSLSSLSARRTVFAQDNQGRLLIILTPFSNAKLGDLAAYLAVSGLNISTAVNMDGGASTAMFLATGGPSQYTPGLSAVPVVLAVYQK